MSEPVLHWYVFETFAGAEWQVYRELMRQGYQAWLGYYIDDVTRGRYKRGATRVYIEGYVFVRADRKWLRTARKVIGVQALVTNADGFPAAIDDDVMNDLIARLSSAFRVDIAMAPIISFEPGQQKKINDGPFKGLLVEIARVVSHDKIKVWMDAMGRKVEIEVQPAQLSHNVEVEKHCA